MRTVAILASGPSMSQAIADEVRHLDCIAINDTYRLAPWAMALYAADAAWWAAHPEALNFPGRKLAGEIVPGVEFVEPKPLARGGNSALRATQWAVEQGADEVLLFGVDLDPEAPTHWHGLHAGLRNPDRSEFEQAAEAWGEFAKQPGLPPIINCNPASKLECFPKVRV